MEKELEGKTIVLGVTGSIAAYKAALLARALRAQGGQVYTLLTRGATAFISPLTFQALTGNPALVEMFEPATDWQIEHVSLAQAADAVVIAPCTAHVIGKIANGLSDDLLSVTVMATRAPVVIAPAMDAHMYESPGVQANVAQLREWGFTFVGPERGELATGLEGLGRLAEISDILAAVVQRVRSSS